jgi:hypothetical protein
MQEAQELGLEFEPRANGIVLAGALSSVWGWLPKLEEVMPVDAIVLSEGIGHDAANVSVDKSWVEHGAVDESGVTQDDQGHISAEVSFYYKWAVYTTQEVVLEKRSEKLEDFIAEQLGNIDDGLNNAGGHADDRRCADAFFELAEKVYPAYEALAERLSEPGTEADVLSFSLQTLRYWSKTVNLDLSWLQEIEHDCDVGKGVDRRPRFAVLDFFQKVYDEKDDEG